MALRLPALLLLLIFAALFTVAIVRAAAQFAVSRALSKDAEFIILYSGLSTVLYLFTVMESPGGSVVASLADRGTAKVLFDLVFIVWIPLGWLRSSTRNKL